MINSRALLVAALQQYETTFEDESVFKNRFLSLLQFPGCFNRDFLPGHITGSCWIVDHTGTHVLLTLHAKLNRWLQPGGHADGDENIYDVALREAEEETGLKKLTPLQPDKIFDIDIHLIPARKEMPDHDHYDIRFIFQADKKEQIIISEESHDLQWIPLEKLEDYTDNVSILRMREKCKHYFN